MNYFEMLQDAITQTHGCQSYHVESVPVKEGFRGETVWEGLVEVFRLDSHPQAKTFNAWGHHIEGKAHKSRYVTVLGVPPVNSPQDAVRASIISDSKNMPKRD